MWVKGELWTFTLIWQTVARLWQEMSHWRSLRKCKTLKKILKGDLAILKPVYNLSYIWIWWDSQTYWYHTLIKKAGNMVTEPKRSQKSWSNISRLDTLKRHMFTLCLHYLQTKAYLQLVKVNRHLSQTWKLVMQLVKGIFLKSESWSEIPLKAYFKMKVDLRYL